MSTCPREFSTLFVLAEITRRRALELLAASRDGCTEAIMLVAAERRTVAVDFSYAYRQRTALRKYGF